MIYLYILNCLHYTALTVVYSYICT